MHGAALDKAWGDRCEDLARAADSLREINSQDALILLRSSFSAPKVLHLLRCSPPVSHPSLTRFDALLRGTVKQIIIIIIYSFVYPHKVITSEAVAGQVTSCD